MPWDYTYITTTPAGGDDPREADDRMREIKAAIQERENVDHYWPASATNTYDDTDTGEHRKVTLRTGVAPTHAADKGIIYAKDVSGKAELFYIDEDGNEVQLTTGGIIKLTSAALLGILANDTHFTAVNEAGDGEVDLIKAARNEADDADVAQIPDITRLASDAAPTEDTQVVNMKYVDDQIAAAVPDDDAFGSWASKSNSTSYEAATDGLVVAQSGFTGADIIGYTDGNDPPITLRTRNYTAAGGHSQGITMPVRKGDYWKVTGATTVYWLPIGG